MASFRELQAQLKDFLEEKGISNAAVIAATVYTFLVVTAFSADAFYEPDKHDDLDGVDAAHITEGVFFALISFLVNAPGVMFFLWEFFSKKVLPFIDRDPSKRPTATDKAVLALSSILAAFAAIAGITTAKNGLHETFKDADWIVVGPFTFNALLTRLFGWDKLIKALASSLYLFAKSQNSKSKVWLQAKRDIGWHRDKLNFIFEADSNESRIDVKATLAEFYLQVTTERLPRYPVSKVIKKSVLKIGQCGLTLLVSGLFPIWMQLVDHGLMKILRPIKVPAIFIGAASNEVFYLISAWRLIPNILKYVEHMSIKGFRLWQTLLSLTIILSLAAGSGLAFKGVVQRQLFPLSEVVEDTVLDDNPFNIYDDFWGMAIAPWVDWLGLLGAAVANSNALMEFVLMCLGANGKTLFDKLEDGLDEFRGEGVEADGIEALQKEFHNNASLFKVGDPNQEEKKPLLSTNSRRYDSAGFREIAEFEGVTFWADGRVSREGGANTHNQEMSDLSGNESGRGDRTTAARASAFFPSSRDHSGSEGDPQGLNQIHPSAVVLTIPEGASEAATPARPARVSAEPPRSPRKGSSAS